MSFSWTYLTRRFVGMNYRDYAAMMMVSTYVVGQTFRATTKSDDNLWTRQQVYTHDETDIRYRETTNRTDGAVKREHAMKYAAKIKAMRAERERAAQLDAFNYLHGKNLSV